MQLSIVMSFAQNVPTTLDGAQKNNKRIKWGPADHLLVLGDNNPLPIHSPMAKPFNNIGCSEKRDLGKGESRTQLGNLEEGKG